MAPWPSAGHFSKSGRFDLLHEGALEWAFLLKCCARAARTLGLPEPSKAPAS